MSVTITRNETHVTFSADDLRELDRLQREFEEQGVLFTLRENPHCEITVSFNQGDDWNAALIEGYLDEKIAEYAEEEEEKGK